MEFCICIHTICLTQKSKFVGNISNPPHWAFANCKESTTVIRWRFSGCPHLKIWWRFILPMPRAAIRTMVTERRSYSGLSHVGTNCIPSNLSVASKSSLDLFWPKSMYTHMYALLDVPFRRPTLSPNWERFACCLAQRPQKLKLREYALEMERIYIPRQ